MNKWYLIKAKPRQEQKAKQNLENQGYVVFCPMAKTKKQYVALFPGYLFVQLSITKQNCSPINSTIGVSHFVKFGLNFAKVHNDIIKFLKANQHITTKKLSELSRFKCGDKVEISNGIFKNYVAIFKCYKPNDRVILLMKFFGREQSVGIDKESVTSI